MKILNFREALLTAGLLLLAVPACAQMGKPPGQPPGKSPVRPQPGKASPDVESMIPNACYRGIEPEKEVCLKDGRSEGPPAVVLAPERAAGDLDGDGAPETAVLLVKNPGDPLQETYLAAVARQGSRIVNLATTLLGNQVRVQSLTVSGGKIRLQGSRSASARTAMMPVNLVFSLRDGKLVQEEM
ncbi:MAG: hypothetical protein ACJ76N_10525 [Thermoanaerobaculia bacterium]